MLNPLFQYGGRWLVAAWCCAWLALIAHANVPASALAPPADIRGRMATGQDLKSLVKEVLWLSNAEDARHLAARENRPLLMYFYSPECTWCQRLDQEVLNLLEIRQYLAPFVLLKVNLLVDSQTPARFRVRGTPTLVFMSPEGRETGRLDGFADAVTLLPRLQEVLGHEPQSQDKQVAFWLQQLRARVLSTNDWPGLILALGNDHYRDGIRQELAVLQPPPRRELVNLLAHPMLAVRLGALEVLEEIAGNDLDFDPWLVPAAERAEKLKPWIAWANSTNAVVPRTAGLTAEAMEHGLIDWISDDLERASRARRALARAGSATLAAIAAYETQHPELSTGARLRLRELRYSLLLPPIAGQDPASLAHRLVFGNLDAKLRAIRATGAGRPGAVVVLRDFLQDPEPLVRETTIDTLAASGRRIVSLLDGHLKTEADPNVVYAALRQLGAMRSKQGLNVLLRFLTHTNEDLVVVSLESIAKLRANSCAEEIRQRLHDPRWRVRVAALKTAQTLSLQALNPDAVRLLEDPDEFVRTAAVEALGRLGLQTALPKLGELFAKEDRLKGPIIRGLLESDVALPGEWLRLLQKASPSILLSVLDSIEDSSNQADGLLNLCARHADPDVALAALRKISAYEREDNAFSETIANLMQSPDRRRVLGVMNSYMPPYADVALMRPAIQQADFNETLVQPKQNPLIEEIFSAFEGRPAPAKSPLDRIIAGDVLQAFESQGAQHENYIETLRRVSARYLASPADAEMRGAAARFLVLLGDCTGITNALEELPRLATDQRMLLARGLNRIRNGAGLPLIKRLLADPNAEIRQAACRALIHNNSEAGMQLILQEWVREGAILTTEDVSEITRWNLEQPKFKSLAANFCLPLLSPATNSASPLGAVPQGDERRTFALTMAAFVWNSRLAPAVELYLVSTNPLQRRAAWYAVGKNQPARLLKEMARVAADASDYVREVVPALFMGENSAVSWQNYYAEGRFYDHYSFNGRRQSPAWSSEVAQVIDKLAQDRVERIRLLAMFCLISNEQPVNLTELAGLLEKLPTTSALRAQFSSFFTTHYERMGKSFAILVPQLHRDTIDPEQLAKIRAHFNLDEEAADNVAVPDAVAPSVMASYVKTKVASQAASPPTHLSLVYFTKPGCKECAAVAATLEQLKTAFPELKVHEYDIQKTVSATLNEALSERFQVPVATRLVAPAVFAGGGYLIKSDISLARLGQLLLRSRSVPETNWLVFPRETLVAAGQQIEQRYHGASWGLILAAGLLDGINPCAFATIVFLLSYLQVTRKSPREIAQVGVAYIIGVFLAYFLIGLGLAQIAAMVARLRWVGLILNYAMAAFALVIMGLSIRDGWRALHGQLAEMTLQLPAWLKNRIHRLIREGVRQAHFILAAFFLGAAISFLELACTGQVYLPTITYMIQQGETRATGDLLGYNLAFIAPLTLIFLGFHYGLRSETLLALLKNHAAWVKFSTALLFLALAIFLVVGPHWH